MSFQEHVQKVFQKQESTEEMFHRRQASLKKLAAKQTRPVQPVAPRPEALTKSPSPSPGTLFSQIGKWPASRTLPAPCSPQLRAYSVTALVDFTRTQPHSTPLSAVAAFMPWPRQSWVPSAES